MYFRAILGMISGRTEKKWSNAGKTGKNHGLATAVYHTLPSPKAASSQVP
jgi:hypothetical protein